MFDDGRSCGTRPRYRSTPWNAWPFKSRSRIRMRSGVEPELPSPFSDLAAVEAYPVARVEHLRAVLDRARDLAIRLGAFFGSDAAGSTPEGGES